MGFLPQLPTTFCSLLWREYENVKVSRPCPPVFFRLSHSEDPGTCTRALPLPLPWLSMAMAYRS